jgi:hypothetical protein
MSKYKCLNRDCNNRWTTDEEPFECPNCHEDNFEKENDSKKIIWWIIGGVAALIMIIAILRGCCGDGTIVNVKYDKNSQELSVELTGEQIDKYEIVIKRNGEDFESTKKSKYHKTFDIPGTYSIIVNWKDKSKMPRQKWNGIRSFEIEGKPISQQTLSILRIDILYRDVKKKQYNVKVETDTTTVVLANTEFSINGTNYYPSNVFVNIQGGKTCIFYARNKNNISQIATYEYPFPEIVTTPSPPDKVVNDLLSKMANGDKGSFKDWRNKVEEGLTIPVQGAANITNSYELAQEAMQGKAYKVYTERDADDKITKIIVQ